MPSVRSRMLGTRAEERNATGPRTAQRHSAWRCAAGCRCTGNLGYPDALGYGCPCGMDERPTSVDHIWLRSAILAGVTGTGKSRLPALVAEGTGGTARLVVPRDGRLRAFAPRGTLDPRTTYVIELTRDAR